MSHDAKKLMKSFGLLLALSDRMGSRSFQPWLPGLFSAMFLKLNSLKVKNWPAFLFEKMLQLSRKIVIKEVI